MNDDFKVKVGQFEGPLDLLLELIEKRKLHISDVSLSQVADDFIRYTETLEEGNGASAADSQSKPTGQSKKKYFSDVADFILIASTLLLIKSKSLLPGLPLTEEEQESIDDLEARLLAYKKYKELSGNVGKIFGNFLYFASERKQAKALFAPTPDISPSSLKSALLQVLKNVPQKIEALPRVAVQKIISLEEMIGNLSERIKVSLRTSFKDFAQIGKTEKVNVIVSFLAMLELVKQGIVRVSQDKHFEDISIEGENLGVPNY